MAYARAPLIVLGRIEITHTRCCRAKRTVPLIVLGRIEIPSEVHNIYQLSPLIVLGRIEIEVK